MGLSDVLFLVGIAVSALYAATVGILALPKVTRSPSGGLPWAEAVYDHAITAGSSVLLAAVGPCVEDRIRGRSSPGS